MKSISTVALLAVVSASGLSHADTSFYSGQFCNAEKPSYGKGYAIASGMSHNGAHSAYPINCPGSWQTSATNGQANAYFAITAATVNLYSGGVAYCYVNQVNWDGSLYSSTSLYGCGTTGGCSSADPYFSGQAQLNWTNPINSGTSYYTLGASISCTQGAIVYQYNLSGM